MIHFSLEEMVDVGFKMLKEHEPKWKYWKARLKRRERKQGEKQFLCRAQTAVLTLSFITKSHNQLQG